MAGTKTFEVVYCPHHLGIHDSAWCTAGDHIGLGVTDPAAAFVEARRRGYTFYHGDVITLRDSADNPRVGDVVGDRRVWSGRRFHAAYLREVVAAGEDTITWTRPGKNKQSICSMKTWRRWAKGSCRCGPEGKPTQRRFKP